MPMIGSLRNYTPISEQLGSGLRILQDISDLGMRLPYFQMNALLSI